MTEAYIDILFHMNNDVNINESLNVGYASLPGVLVGVTNDLFALLICELVLI